MWRSFVVSMNEGGSDMVERVMEGVKVPQEPHGGELVNQVLTGEALEEVREKAKPLPLSMIDCG